jgi:hypothetical protein
MNYGDNGDPSGVGFARPQSRRRLRTGKNPVLVLNWSVRRNCRQWVPIVARITYAMGRAVRILSVLVIALTESASIPASPIQVYGVWHCGSDLCAWGTIRDMAEFDRNNHWLIDRGDGSPSVNLVVLSFVNPVKLLNLANDRQTVEGIPIGMSSEIVSYFTRRRIRVMVSIGGLTYIKDWDRALAANPQQLGINAARAAQRLGVGTEIDYENDRSPNLKGLQDFITAYRSIVPFDAAATNPAARLTIDLALDDGYLVPLTQCASANWLTTRHLVLDYANAMVPFEQLKASAFEKGWEEHVRGKPPILPLAPAKFTGSLYIANAVSVSPDCDDFSRSLESATGSFVQTVQPRGSGKTEGMLGYMFWAAECSGSKSVCTTPPNTCQGGVGMGAKIYDIPLPMPPLRQD